MFLGVWRLLTEGTVQFCRFDSGQTEWTGVAIIILC